MPSKVVKAEPSQICVSRDASIFQFDLEGGAVLCAYHPQQGIGGGIHFSDWQTNRDLAIKNLLKALEGLTQTREGFEFKTIGQADALGTIENLLKPYGQKISKSLELDCGRTEAYFYSESGRLRVAKVEVPTQKVSMPPQLTIVQPDRKRRVLIVDDSKTIRVLLRRIFEEDDRLEVVGDIEDPRQVLKAVRDLKPDVMTLDIHMPHMDGVQVVKSVFPVTRIPIVMISSVRMEEGPQVLEALEFGAVDYVKKPSLEELDQMRSTIVERVLGAANARVSSRGHEISSDRLAPFNLAHHPLTVFMGSSTGGTEALRQVLVRLPADIPPILIVQHIPAVFSTAFAKRLNELCAFEVKEAADGDEVRNGRVLIAPGGLQMELKTDAKGFKVHVFDGPPVNRHKPSVDVLFHSAAQLVGKKALSVMLTGMGSDGAKGMLEMKNAGARTLGQDEESSVVYGMPRAAFQLGAVERQVPLHEMSEAMAEVILKHGKKL